jgi:hypothetical protein
MASPAQLPSDESDALRRRAEVAEDYASALAIGLAEADESIGALRARIGELQAALMGRGELLALREAELAKLLRSRSWRLTAPLRALKARLR